MNERPSLHRIQVSSQSVEEIRAFCDQVVRETYNRFRKSYSVRYERIFAGKLGEVAFSQYLCSRGVQHDTSGMFAVYEGTTNVDSFDFVSARTRAVIDVKTAYKRFHTRIMVPYGRMGQWDQMPKDFYVGVKADLVLDIRGSIDFSANSNPIVTIYGYIPRNHVAWHGPKDFGEGLCMWAYLASLEPIDGLVDMLMEELT